MNSKLITRLAAGSILSAFALATTHAADRTWNVSPPTETDFNDGANWSPSFVGPWSATGDNAIISNGGTAVMSGGAALIGQIIVGQVSSGISQGTLRQTGGDITLNDGLVVGRQGTSVGTYEMTGGTLTGANFRVGGGSKTSQGTVNISGSDTIFTTTQNGTAGVVGIGVPGNGTVNISDSAVWNHTGTTVLVVGGDNNAIGQNVAGTGELTVSSGAQVNLQGGGNLAIGRNTGTGTVTVDGGSLTLSNAGVINMGNAFGAAAGGTGELTLNSGSITAFRINLTIADNKTPGTGTATVNLNGGTATIGGMGKGDGTANVHFNGAEIIASESNADFYTGFASENLDIQAGGQHFNTNGFDVGINPGMSGVGGLTKSGVGSLTLAGENVYAGATTVQEGTLLVSGSIAGSSLSVENGAFLSLLNADSLGDTIVLNLFTGSSVDLSFLGAEIVGLLNLNGSAVAPGTYSLADLQGFGLEEGITFTGNSDAFLTVAVPEPSTITLIGGVAVVAFAARLRRSRRAN